MLQCNSQGFCFQKKINVERRRLVWCVYILHSDLKQKRILVWEPRVNMHEPADNEYTAVGILSDNVGQTSGVHVGRGFRLNPPLSWRWGQGGPPSVWNSLCFVCTLRLSSAWSGWDSAQKQGISVTAAGLGICEGFRGENHGLCSRQRAGHAAASQGSRPHGVPALDWPSPSGFSHTPCSDRALAPSWRFYRWDLVELG